MLKLYYAKIELIKEKTTFDPLFEKMNMQRRNKVLRCKNEMDKCRSLLAGYLLRMALEKEGYAYDDLSFSKSENGKPLLESQPAVFFSLSHSGEYAVCAISDREIGVDIESRQKRLFEEDKENMLQAVVEKSLSKKEKSIYFQCEPSEQPALFLQYWTRKESYSKALGKGLGFDFKCIETNTEHFWTKWIDSAYCMSIYVEDGRFYDLQIEEIKALQI